MNTNVHPERREAKSKDQKSPAILLLLAFLSLAPAVARADLAHRRTPVVEVVQKVSPAVVFIGTEQYVQTQYSSPMEQFYDELYGGGRERLQAVQSLGSGVIIDPSGIIVTNDHVIHGASAIHVVLADGRKMDADVIGSDADNDVAVLKVHAREALQAARLGTSNDLMIGETVVAIGSPFGLAKTVTAGVISAVGRSFRANDRVYNDFIQTDTAINPGNSGGPLLNIDGEVIGINTAIFASAQGIGFAIPADKVRRIVTELTQFGKVRPAWVGVEADSLSPELARQLNWDRNYGVIVSRVDSGSPAAEAGLKQGDVIAEVGGTPVSDPEDLAARLRGYPAKSKITFQVSREGRLQQLTIVPVEFPPTMAETIGWERLGLKVKPSHGAMVISSVRSRSPAASIGLAPGDLLLRLNNQPLASLAAYRDALLAARSAHSVLLLVQRGNTGYYLTLPF
jgi:serine protease Do